MMRFSTRQLRFVSMMLCYGGLALWLGGLVMFGFGVASVVFRHVPTKDLAGHLNGIILGRLNTLEFVAAALLLLGTSIHALAERSWRIWLPVMLVGIMLVVTFSYTFHIAPAMDALKQQISSFDTPQSTDEPLIAQFRGYHVWYSRLVSVNVLLALTVLSWKTWQFTEPLAEQPAPGV